MILIEKSKAMNFEGAMRGMRNPMNSWDKSDSSFTDFSGMPIYVNELTNEEYEACLGTQGEFTVGENDQDLARRLCTSGSDHGKLARQIFVCVDITAPLYWWKEFDTYKVGTTANSTSTMHKLGSRPLTIGDFSFDEEDGSVDCTDSETQDMIDSLNRKISLWKGYTNSAKNATTPEGKADCNRMAKRVWRRMVQDLPSSFNQTRTVTLDYENLRNIYFARRNHKLTEWHTVCHWIESLPYSFLITEPRLSAKEKHQSELIQALSKDIQESLQVVAELSPTIFIEGAEKLTEALLKIQGILAVAQHRVQSPDPTAN